MSRWAIPLPLLAAAFPQDDDREIRAYDAYKAVVEKTAAMVGDAEAQHLARKYGLQILNVTWEDTGRSKGSFVGPNISDMTIQVQLMDPRNEKFTLHCMPVIRFPNFQDKSADLPPDKFHLLVGNEKGRDLRKITLKELLRDLRAHLSQPQSWKGDRTSLLADRDTHVLVSAQACFLPIPKKGTAEFNPVLFNYQSYQGDPAVLTILATREGTSVTVIDNHRDAFQAGRTWGQRLFFNLNGKRAVLSAKRLSDHQAETGGAGGPAPDAAGESGLNMVLLIQVPLKQKRPMPVLVVSPTGAVPRPVRAPAAAPRSDVEPAVIGHGRVEGPFTEIGNLEIERDPRFPVRVTVQFYKAPSNGVVSEADMADLAKQIDRVYKEADYVGSLVTEGFTGRPTEHAGPKWEPPAWWEAFWKRYETNTGESRDKALERLRRLIRDDYRPQSEQELERDLGRAGIIEDAHR